MKTIELENIRFEGISWVAKHLSFLKKIPLLPILIDEQIKLLTFLFKPSVLYLMSALNKTVKSWEGIQSSYHRFGGLQFDYQGKEIGHLHGNGLLDLKLNQKLNHLHKHPLIEAHHFLGEGNWVSIKIRSNTNLDELLAVVKSIYENRRETK